MKKSFEEIKADIRGYIGDDLSDNALTLLEDIEDSLVEGTPDEYEAKYKELKTQYDTLDETWRKRYKERFYDGAPENEDTTEIVTKEEETKEEKTIDDLFEEKEG